MINVYMDGCVRVGKPGEHKFLPVDKIPKQHTYIYIYIYMLVHLYNSM